MSSSRRAPTVKPEVEFVVDLLTQIETGRLRAPRFQRPFVWRPHQMRDLFDSIEQGYPVGTLLLWDTDVPHRSLDTMGVLELPPQPSGTISYLLDGHQRLSTLFSVLKLPENHPHDPDDGSWKWWIFRDLLAWSGNEEEEGSASPSRFDHVRRNHAPVTYFPLRATLRTTDFLGFARKLERSLKSDCTGREIDALIERAEEVATRIKTYKMGLIRVVGGDLAQAVEIFSRLNSKGQKMSPDQMVAALTYREDDAGGFSLSEQLEEIQEELANLYFGEIPREVVFRSVLAATGQNDIQRTDWSRLAQSIGDDVPSSIGTARRALESAIVFLRDYVNVPVVRLVPYSAQLVLISTFYIECQSPTEAQREVLARWFWSTSFSGWFAGANTTQLKKSIESMRAFARQSIDAQRLSGYGEKALPYPVRFDLRSARVRTLLLWQLRTCVPLDAEGREIDIRHALTLHETRAWRHVLRSQVSNTDGQSDPANRILLPPLAGQSVRQTIMGLDPDVQEDARVLASHFICREAHQALAEEDYESFVGKRASMLASGEKEFLEMLGLEAADRERGESNVDTEIYE